jgi:DNA repair protein RecO (recombination protein O)
MPRQIIKTKAIVLRSWRTGESSKRVAFYTEEHGKLTAIAKGARKPKSKYGGCLELMNEVDAVVYMRSDRDLQTLSDCDLDRSFAQLAGDVERLSFGSASCELVDRLTIDCEPNKHLYRCLSGVLGALEEVSPAQVEPVFWYFQLRVCQALGYRPELRHCVSCGGEAAEHDRRFSTALGGVVCGSCSATGGQQSMRISQESVNFLAHLQGLRTYRREYIPEAPGNTREPRLILSDFIEFHAERRGSLRSLEFLKELSRYGSARSY